MKKLLTIQQSARSLLLSAPSFYRLVTEGLLPPPFKVSPNRSVVYEYEILSVIEARATGADDEVIKSLIAELVENRSHLMTNARGAKSKGTISQKINLCTAEQDMEMAHESV